MLDPKLREIDQRIQRFRECKIAFEAAGSATCSRLGGLAARAGSFTVPQFQRLGIRLERTYTYGDRAGLSAAEIEAVDARRERFGNGGATSR